MSNLDGQMPLYNCHKQVWALKITGIYLNNRNKSDGSAMIETQGDFSPIRVSAEYMLKHEPEVGGYYVVYKDGYKSYSTANAFEDGYTLA